MRSVKLPDGTTVPALGQGTWMMAEDSRSRAAEMAALRRGVELGMTLIDTAEMYADGESERLVGAAIAHVRDEVFLVSKACPHNASAAKLAAACEASLKRLGTDRLDLYLLHWRGSVPLGETVEAMEVLVASGKILLWGVSNFDVEDMEELIGEGGANCSANQILFNLGRRGPEFELRPWLLRQKIPTMAYSPIEQGRLAAHPALAGMSRNRGTSAAQIAIAWLLARDQCTVIPKAGSIEHVEANRAAADIILTEDELKTLDAAFPVPTRKRPLEML